MDPILTTHVLVAFGWGFVAGLSLDRWLLPALVDLSARWRRHGRR
jgi:hypothetical protein